MVPSKPDIHYIKLLFMQYFVLYCPAETIDFVSANDIFSYQDSGVSHMVLQSYWVSLSRGCDEKWEMRSRQRNVHMFHGQSTVNLERLEAVRDGNCILHLGCHDANNNYFMSINLTTFLPQISRR